MFSRQLLELILRLNIETACTEMQVMMYEVAVLFLNILVTTQGKFDVFK